MSPSPRFRRGTSVIVSLVLAVVLGAVILGIHAVESNSANTAALPAQALQPITYGNANSAATNNLQQISQKTPTCAQVLATAVQDHSNTPPTNVNIPNVSGENVDYSCNAAVKIGTNKAGNISYTNDTAPPSGAQTQTDPTTGSIYECVGMSGKITVPSGAQTIPVIPDTSVPAGTCSLQYCEPPAGAISVEGVGTVPSSSEQCYPARQYSPSADTTSSATNLPNSTAGSPCANNGESCGTGLICQNYQCVPGTVPFGSGTSNGVGGQVVNCDAANAPASCSGNQSPTDPNTYCYDNMATCYPPAGQTAMSGYTCSPVSGVETCTQGQTQTPGTPCPSGQGTQPNCSTTQAPQSPQAPQTQQPSTQSGNTNGLGALSSFLSGLAKGLSPCGGAGTSYTLVPTTQIINGQAVTTYVQQPTTAAGTPCSSTAAQSAPYGVGTNGAACSAPPSPPQCSTNATAMPLYANGCLSSYQCVPTSGSTISQTPTPQISCSPQVADVGESVAISYSCQNATGSSAAGFSTGNNLSGSATATVTAPPSGQNTVTYGLTCTNNGQNASAQCSVQINQPAIDLVANPQTVPSGSASTIGWVTAGMQSCVISSPQDTTFTANNASDTSTSGSAQTDPITGATEYVLTCQTLAGETQTAETTVNTGAASSTPSSSVTVNSSVDGQTVNYGDTVTVTWNSSSTPSGSALSLWLIDVQTEQATALIAGDEPTSGSYQWQVPASGSTCVSGSIAPCASDLVAGDSYGIEAAVYTPSDAYLGGTPEPANPVSPSYSGYGYTPEPFTIEQ